tara:strand:- start:565 stop:951 length:387 start_codon:yes stop_codon:yes gene_type:complete
MSDLDKFRGMNPPEIDLISKKVHGLLRDHARFIEIVNSLSGLFSEYELLLEYLKENNIVFQKEQVDEKIAPELHRLNRNPILLRRILEQISERFYLSMRGLEKLDEALSQSKNLFEQKFFLERNFHNS